MVTRAGGDIVTCNRSPISQGVFRGQIEGLLDQLLLEGARQYNNPEQGNEYSKQDISRVSLCPVDTVHA